MAARWRRMLAAAVVGSLAGCSTSGPSLKTPMPERFVLPPSDDVRFSQPIAYPKETLNEDQVIRPTNSNGKMPSQTPPLTQPNRGAYGVGPGM